MDVEALGGAVGLDRRDRRPDRDEELVDGVLVAVIVATMRTADRSGATSPACGGAVAGSGMASNTGTVWPFTVTVRPLSVAMAARDERPRTPDR